MYRKVTEKKVTKTEAVYTWVARDGKEFDNRNDCDEYEISLDTEWNKKKEYIDSLIIASLDNLQPINTDPNGDFEYKYFKILTPDDLEKLREVYRIDTEYLETPDTFPAVIVCQNTSNYLFNELTEWEDLNDARYELIWNSLENMMFSTIKFFNNLGYDVSFEQLQNRNEVR